jgi:hypothetical protein
MLNTIGNELEAGDVQYMGDPKALEKGDINKVSPIKEFRRLGLAVRTRKRMDRNSMDIISTLLRRKGGITIHEAHNPLLIRALRKASHKLVKGVKSAAMDNTGEEYPLYALRVALDGAMSHVKVTSY